MKCAACLSLLLILGCVDVTTNDGKPAPAAKDNCWEYLARQIEAGNVTNTDELILVVDRLKDENAISAADQDAFYSKFDGIKDKQRDVDHVKDSVLLRSL